MGSGSRTQYRIDRVSANPIDYRERVITWFDPGYGAYAGAAVPDIAMNVPLRTSVETLALMIALGSAVPALDAQMPTADALFIEARSAVAAGDYDAAIRQLERAVESDGNNAEYHYWLGRALYEAAPHASKIKMPGMARRVRKEWERTVALDSDHLEGRAGLVEYYAMAPGFMGGSKVKAREQAAEIAERSPMRGAMARAAIARHEKNWSVEEQAYEQAIAFSPDSLSPYVALADAYVRTGRTESAFAALARYTTRRPRDAWGLYHRGRLAGTTGQLLDEGDHALHAFLDDPPADITAPARSGALYWQGRIAERRGSGSAARLKYLAAVQVNPTNHLAKQALEKLK